MGEVTKRGSQVPGGQRIMREEDRAGMVVTQQTFRQNLPYRRPSARSGSVTSVTQMCPGCLRITFT